MADADDFFRDKRTNDPENWQRTKEKYSVQPESDRFQIYYDPAVGSLVDESPQRRRKRLGKSGNQVPLERRKRLDPEEWSEYRKNKAEYNRQWLEDYHYAKELADQGM